MEMFEDWFGDSDEVKYSHNKFEESNTILGGMKYEKVR